MPETPISSQVVTAGRKLVGKVVKESCRRRRMWKVEDGLRNRFLEVQLRPPIAEASTYWRTPK